MYFAWFIKDYLSKVPDTLMGSILKGVKTLVFSLDTWIYGLIIDLYNMFSSLCTVRLLSNELLQELSQRIGYVLGVVMLFYVILSFIQMLLNPDVIMDKEKGAVSIIKKTIIVIVMLGSANFVFNTLYQVQNMVVKSNVISKLLLPYTITTSINNQDSDDNGGSIVDDNKFGSLLSEELLMSFYQLEQFDSIDDMGESDANTYTACQATVNSFRAQIINYKRFDLGYNCLNEEVTVKFLPDSEASGVEQETSIINFNWLLSPVCGLAVAYLIFMYCLKVGVRMVQLMFLEIISPMAFVSYLAPKKDTMFSKWQGIYISTYIDVFVRIAVINFVFFLIATIFSTTENNGLEFQGTNLANNSFFKVVIILSLLTFAKKAPELISELLPKSKSKLGFGASMKDIVGLNRGIGTIAGATTGAVVGFLGGKGIGAIGGIFRGARAGFGAKGIGSAISTSRKNQAEHNVAARNGQLPGFFGSIGNSLGVESAKERYDGQISALEKSIDAEKVETATIRRQAAAYSNASGYRKKAEERAENKLLNDHFATGDIRRAMQENLLNHQARIKVAERSGDASAIARAQMEYNTQLDSAKQEYITLASRGNAHGGFDDAGMNAIFNDLQHEIDNDSRTGTNAFDGINLDLSTGYSGLKSFDDEVTVRNANVSERISRSDANIKVSENAIQEIKNSQGYRDSHKIK